ncbi:GntP family permease [Propionimicrobium sp. PCR01-08-3]|uniref:GntP family permease n=1 Tax=Propionimicrobium sp. PCR01-08-3 TaxID=3052086 RepID=UPI00255D0B4C|nr:GntP family permease [Propionimicrobium sp. PCR01-08-3]WIY81564.1 GntP family permease [Propionimicrobium sp. PCR01-08-3]
MAPIAALLAVVLTEPTKVLPVYTNLFMVRMAFFVQNYFPIFMLGALFGKMMEISGFAKSIASAVVRVVGEKFTIMAIVLVGAILTYGGVSMFVAVFAVYPFAAEMFKESDIPKRLIPATIGLGVFAFTMDALPGTPQIQNIIPTTFFGTTAFSAPILGIFGSLFVFVVGMLYLEWRRRTAKAAGEGYGSGHLNEPVIATTTDKLVHPLIAALPLVLVWVANLVFTKTLPSLFPDVVEFQNTSVPAKNADPESLITSVTISGAVATWALIIGLVLGIVTIFIIGRKQVTASFIPSSKDAIAGSLLANLNTASEFGFAGVIASLPGFKVAADALLSIPNPLLSEAVTVNVLAGVTGSASGGLSMALGAMGDHFIDMANDSGIPLDVMHRIASMAAGGMDTLPHNGAIITVLAVTGLTHRQSYKDIFAITLLKCLTAFVTIGFYYLTGLV